MKKKTFYITFGQKYRDGSHPQGMTPDGWAEIKAKDDLEARQKAHDTFGTRWSFIYSKTEFNKKSFPSGCKMVIE